MKRRESEKNEEARALHDGQLVFHMVMIEQRLYQVQESVRGDGVVAQAGSTRGSACTMSLDAMALIWFLARRESL